ncbi:Kinesin heavy chain, partial [Podila humilis]
MSGNFSSDSVAGHNSEKYLVEENFALKKKVENSERTLVACNERIQSLERLLQDLQEKLTLQKN